MGNLQLFTNLYQFVHQYHNNMCDDLTTICLANVTGTSVYSHPIYRNHCSALPPCHWRRFVVTCLLIWRVIQLFMVMNIVIDTVVVPGAVAQSCIRHNCSILFFFPNCPFDILSVLHRRFSTSETIKDLYTRKNKTTKSLWSLQDKRKRKLLYNGQISDHIL